MTEGFFDALNLTDEELQRVIDDLVAKGFLERRGADVLRLTETGRVALEAIDAKRRGAFQ